MPVQFQRTNNEYNAYETEITGNEAIGGATPRKAHDSVKAKKETTSHEYVIKILLGIQIVMAIGAVIAIAVIYSHIQEKSAEDFDTLVGKMMKLENNRINDSAFLRTMVKVVERDITNHSKTLQEITMKKIEDITNDSETLQEITMTKIEDIRKEIRAMPISDCSKVTPGDFKTGNKDHGVFDIYVAGFRIDVSCDLSTDGGGWTIMQRRMDGSEDFYRNHTDYAKGFGNISGEFWMGLDNIHNILQSANHFELRIDMEDWVGRKAYAKYSRFSVGPPWSNYPLTVSGFSGSAGDSLSAQSGVKFSTIDNDVDAYEGSCAKKYKGAWWYDSCHSSNLNGLYHVGGSHTSYGDGVNSKTWKGYYYSLKFVEMKFRPTS